MGPVLLILFVCGALAFAVWAWRNYEIPVRETPRLEHDHTDKPAVAIRLATLV
jgi:hypothetical protein